MRYDGETTLFTCIAQFGTLGNRVDYMEMMQDWNCLCVADGSFVICRAYMSCSQRQRQRRDETLDFGAKSGSELMCYLGEVLRGQSMGLE